MPRVNLDENSLHILPPWYLAFKYSSRSCWLSVVLEKNNTLINYQVWRLEPYSHYSPKTKARPKKNLNPKTYLDIVIGDF